MRYKIMIRFEFISQIEGYNEVTRIVEEKDFDSNIKILNLMLKSNEITSYEIKMEGH